MPWSNRSIQATRNVIAVSANAKETAYNTEQTLDTAMLVDVGDLPNLEPRRATNVTQAIGKEEPDLIYDRGKLARIPLGFSMLQPQHAAFVMAYALGAVSTSVLVASEAFKHTITPIDDDLDTARSNPSFTLAAQFSQVLKRRFAGCVIGDFSLTLREDDWAVLRANALGSGKVSDNFQEETVNAAKNATSLTLAANGVQGSTAAERLRNVQYIRVELTTGVWTDVAYSAVSAATPAVITITAPGGTADLVNYEVGYIPVESGWMSLPSELLEDPMEVVQLAAIYGGKWNGSAFEGGHQLSYELKNIEWAFRNNITPRFSPGAGVLGYANRAIRSGRDQTITVDRDFRDYLMQQHLDENAYLGLYAKLEGAAISGAPAYKYLVECIWPRVGLMSAALSVDNRRLAERTTLQVLQDDTYGSVIVNVQNKVSAYAA